MQTLNANREQSALRGALTLTWDLNVRAIPTALIWAVSLMFIFQSPNLLTRLVFSVICSLISLLNGTIVKFSHKRISLSQFTKLPEFQRMAAFNVFVGILFILAFSNMLHFNQVSIWISIALKSFAFTLLIGWIGLMLIVNPLFISKVAIRGTKSLAEIFMLYVMTSKKEVLLCGLIVVVCAPLIFVFISLVLTLTQAVTVVKFEALREVEI
jgi:hypothetical protein